MLSQHTQGLQQHLGCAQAEIARLQYDNQLLRQQLVERQEELTCQLESSARLEAKAKTAEAGVLPLISCFPLKQM